MRHIRKPWQPKDVWPNVRQPPCTMQQAEQELLQALQALGPLATPEDKTTCARNDFFDELDKSKLRAVLYKEQRYLCIYCEDRIEDKPLVISPPIAHWIPLSCFPNLALHWNNLHVSCSRRGTCDQKQDKRRLRWDDSPQSVEQDLPWPISVDYGKCIGITKTGALYVRSDAPLTETQKNALWLAIQDHEFNGQKKKSILNLNSKTLIAARKAAIDIERARLMRDCSEPAKNATSSERKSERHNRANALLAAKKQEPYVSARVAYLRREAGKNK